MAPGHCADMHARIEMLLTEARLARRKARERGAHWEGCSDQLSIAERLEKMAWDAVLQLNETALRANLEIARDKIPGELSMTSARFARAIYLARKAADALEKGNAEVYDRLVRASRDAFLRTNGAPNHPNREATANYDD
ncbi:MAG: hypothetical protein ACYDD1_17055 [Caulobacteraceae bacterium]